MVSIICVLKCMRTQSDIMLFVIGIVKWYNMNSAVNYIESENINELILALFSIASG